MCCTVVAIVVVVFGYSLQVLVRCSPKCCLLSSLLFIIYAIMLLLLFVLLCAQRFVSMGRYTVGIVPKVGTAFFSVSSYDSFPCHLFHGQVRDTRLWYDYDIGIAVPADP